jgi:hypothetical protein
MTPNEHDFELVDESAEPLPLARPVYRRRLQTWVRGILVVFAVGFLTVFGIAAWLNPYNADGSPRTMATHTQLGMPPCTMVTMFGKPCPSCGMTTSFSLLIHGDVPNSLRANWAGTLLAAYCLALIPWTAICAVRGRYYFIRSGEALITASVVVMLVVMLGRWAFVILQ